MIRLTDVKAQKEIKKKYVRRERERIFIDSIKLTRNQEASVRLRDLPANVFDQLG